MIVDPEILSQRAAAGEPPSQEEALQLLNLEGPDVLKLVEAAYQVRRRFHGDQMHLCSLINAKSGRCPEDCHFCSQSAHFKTGVNGYKLVSVDEMIEGARRAKSVGASTYCIVCSGKGPDPKDFEVICEAVGRIREAVGIKVTLSLGELEPWMVSKLAEIQIDTYNHNLETAQSHYSNVVTTHTYDDRIQTLKRLREAGVSLCCGGILGMGESREQRLELAYALRELAPECVPVNILNPRPGTPLGGSGRVDPLEVVKTIAVFRLILPQATIKLAGGREVNLRDLQSLGLMAGANGFIISGYLTTPGRDPQLDLQMVEDLGFVVEGMSS